MTRPRKELVCLPETPYDHVVSRCVRRAFLCGLDRHSGRSYEHRRGWIQDRLGLLTAVFAVELCAYAILSNHYHLISALKQRCARLNQRWLCGLGGAKHLYPPPQAA